MNLGVSGKAWARGGSGRETGAGVAFGLATKRLRDGLSPAAGLNDLRGAADTWPLRLLLGRDTRSKCANFVSVSGSASDCCFLIGRRRRTTRLLPPLLLLFLTAGGAAVVTGAAGVGKTTDGCSTVKAGCCG